MTETIQLFLQIIQWVGSLFGLIGGLILILKYFKERPILKINFISSHDIDTDEENSIFQISLDIDNIGDKPTTIKEIYLMIADKKEKDSWYFAEFEDFKMFHLNPRSSIQFLEEVNMGELFKESIEIAVHIDHTHGNEVEKTESYFIPDILPDDDDEDYNE